MASAQRLSIRKFHYLTSIVSLPFILCTTLTGLLWAYAPYLYWDADYLKRQVENTTSLDAGKVQSLAALSSALQKPIGSELREASYKVVAATPVAELCFTKPMQLAVSSSQTLLDTNCALVDAQHGALLSPLSREFASRVAADFVSAGISVASAELSTTWEHRKDGLKPAVWIVRFDDPADTEIIVDAFTARVIEDQDRYRRFHFFIMKLHQFNFFGTHKELVAISGVPLLLLLYSGFSMIRKRLRR